MLALHEEGETYPWHVNNFSFTYCCHLSTESSVKRAKKTLFPSDNCGEGVEAASGCALPRLGRGAAGGAGAPPGPRSAAPQEKKERGKEEAADHQAGQEEEETETPRSDSGA